jgi:hypothetical protein
MLKVHPYTLEELLNLFKESESDYAVDYTESSLNELIGDGYISIRSNDEYFTNDGLSSQEGNGFILIHLKDGYAILPFSSLLLGDGWEQLIPDAFRYLDADDVEVLISIQNEKWAAIKEIDSVFHAMRLPLLYNGNGPEEIKKKQKF